MLGVEVTYSNGFWQSTSVFYLTSSDEISHLSSEHDTGLKYFINDWVHLPLPINSIIHLRFWCVTPGIEEIPSKSLISKMVESTRASIKMPWTTRSSFAGLVSEIV